MKNNKFSKFCNRFLLFVIAVLVCMIILKSNSNIRGFVYRNVFQNNFKFAKVNELYEKYFGKVLPFSKDSNEALVSSEKLEYESSEKYKDGVKLKVSDNYAVPLLDSGIVIFTGEKEGYGNTVIVEGSDEIQIWYSNLKEIKVEMYDYLKKGGIVGEANGDNFILAFTKDGQFIDYKKHI